MSRSDSAVASRWVDRLPDRAWLVLIVGVAALARMIFPGWTEFKADEARLLTLAWEMAEGESFALRGISSSVGIPNFPASVWIYAIPQAIWGHVYSATLFTGLINAAAVGLLYGYVRKVWGKEAALVAALMFAVSPWAIIHARKIWAQNLIAPFAIGWIWTAHLTFVEKRSRFFGLHLVIGVLAFQIHLAAISLLIGTGVLLGMYRRTIRPSQLLIGAGLAAATFIPFFIYAAPRIEELQVLLSSASGGGGSSGVSFNSISHTIRLVTGWQFHALAGPATFERFLAGAFPQRWIVPVWLALGLWGIARLIHAPAPENGPLMVWALIAIPTFLWFPTEVELHYLLPTYPAWFVLAGIGMIGLRGQLRAISWGVFAVSAAVQLIVWGQLLVFLNTTYTPGGYGEPLIDQLAVIERVDALFEPGDEVLIAGEGEDPQLDSFAAVYDLHFRDVPRRFVALSQHAVFPSGRSVWVVSPTVAESPLYAQSAEFAQSNEAVGLRPEEGEIHVLVMEKQTAIAPSFPASSRLLFANWINIIGHDALDSNGGWQVYWQVGEPRSDVRFHMFNHLYQADGARASQADAALFSPWLWRSGDLVISRFQLDLPSEETRPWMIQTGIYEFDSGQRIPILDDAANPSAEWIDFPIFDP